MGDTVIVRGRVRRDEKREVKEIKRMKGGAGEERKGKENRKEQEAVSTEQIAGGLDGGRKIQGKRGGEEDI